jgi:biotin carboxylase
MGDTDRIVESVLDRRAEAAWTVRERAANSLRRPHLDPRAPRYRGAADPGPNRELVRIDTGHCTRMTVLVLHRNPLGPFPYGEWLADYPDPIIVLAARDRIVLAAEDVPTGDLGYRHLELLDDFDDDDLVMDRALALAETFAVTHVIALHEGDVDRAARLREKLGRPGMSSADILPFRDKVVMKQRARAAGIEVAPYLAPHGVDEIRAFGRRWGLPLVFKDRSGFGSRNLHIARTVDDFADQLAAYAAGRDDLLVEAYMPGKMCHVDGLVLDGRIAAAWPSQYQYDLSSFGVDPHPRIDLTLDPGDPLTDRLLTFADRCLAALGGGGGTYAFHAEVFQTPDDRLVLCEVAARPGGARIREVFSALFGFNLAEYAVRAQLGLPLPVLDEHTGTGRIEPRQMAGQMLMMKRPGRVDRLPEPATEPWVEFCGIFARIGQVISPAAGSADFLAAVVASAPDRARCEVRLREVGRRFEQAVVITADRDASS